MTGQDRAVSDRAGQSSARQAGSGQRQTGQVRAGQQGREVPDRTGRGHKGSVRAGQDWEIPGRTWHDQQNRTGAGRAVLGSAGPGWAGHGRL